MPQPDWDALEREVRDLARRVAWLEQHAGQGMEFRATPSTVAAPARPALTPAPLPETTAIFPVLGRALLGLAGAYLLRALTDADTLPPRAGVAMGILYAILWLVWAARTPANRRLEAAIHSLTAVLVLSPLLWEATLRFHAVTTWTAGAILLFFTVFGLAVSWRKDLLIVATIATLAGLGTAAALLVATYDVLPFTLVFLAIAAAVEVSACLDHWLSERWLAATAADLAVFFATWLVTNERGLPEAYAPIPHGWLLGAQVTLLAIYLASTTVRTLFRRFTFTGFETAQCVLAFAISVSGGLRLSHEDPRIAPAIGLVALACGAACYVLSFALLERRAAGSRNFYTYSTFGILLALAGSTILLSGATAATAWSVLAVGCIWAGGHFRRLTLQVHGAIYLLLALGVSGAAGQAAALLLGEASLPGSRPAALATGAVAALLAYAFGAYYARGGTTWNFQVFRLVVAATFVGLAAAIAAGVLTGAYHWMFGQEASHAYCATMRTSVVSGAALVLAWAGWRHNRLELSRLIYPAMALGAYRLLANDLYQDRKAALFLSLLVYGAALTALPRLKRTADLP